MSSNEAKSNSSAFVILMIPKELAALARGERSKINVGKAPFLSRQSIKRSSKFPYNFYHTLFRQRRQVLRITLGLSRLLRGSQYRFLYQRIKPRRQHFTVIHLRRPLPRLDVILQSLPSRLPPIRSKTILNRNFFHSIWRLSLMLFSHTSTPTVQPSRKYSILLASKESNR